jgi:hypothetical protein
MDVLIDFDELHNEKIRIIKKLMKRESAVEFPELLKWAVQLLYFDGHDWIEICRIDNYLHDNHLGAHIHQYGSIRVSRFDSDYYDALDSIKVISAKIIKKYFNDNIKL